MALCGDSRTTRNAPGRINSRAALDSQTIGAPAGKCCSKAAKPSARHSFCARSQNTRVAPAFSRREVSLPVSRASSSLMQKSPFSAPQTPHPSPPRGQAPPRSRIVVILRPITGSDGAKRAIRRQANSVLPTLRPVEPIISMLGQSNIIAFQQGFHVFRKIFIEMLANCLLKSGISRDPAPSLFGQHRLPARLAAATAFDQRHPQAFFRLFQVTPGLAVADLQGFSRLAQAATALDFLQQANLAIAKNSWVLRAVQPETAIGMEFIHPCAPTRNNPERNRQS
ncbi:MAG: hypothetical protein BWY57_02289 [Betaproteobacteria bacterium ADurb.Bin341]|nr:MAG: hypothetical protein BWY57_02289 [Betaproteobacteria bacterium ADurb.Bin341]